MTNISPQELVMALRCSARPRRKEDTCIGCPYRGLEEVIPDLPCPPDLEEDGISYWEYCDTERMAIDAAEMIEKLNEIPMR